MTVSELIEALRTLPQNMQVVYVNDCADYGKYVVTINALGIEAGKRVGQFDSCNFPDNGVVVLS